MVTDWVTGASGFIGAHLLHALAADGVSVAGIGGRRASDGIAADWAEGVITGDGLDQLAGRCGVPKTVYHLAGGASVGRSLEDPARDFELTVGGTATLIDWLRVAAPAARIVFVSSAAVYGVGHDGPIAATAPLQPCSPYGYHKRAAEVLWRGAGQCYGLQVAIVRLFSVYGPGLRKQLLWDLCTRLTRDGRATLGGSGAELRDWADVRDIARLLRLAAGHADPGVPVFNGGRGVADSVADIAMLVAEAIGLERDAIDFSGQTRVGDPFSLIAAPDRLTRDFDWSILPAQGVADYVAWYRGLAH